METAVITGASAGLGARARLFADGGTHVVCGGRDADALQSVATGVREDGGCVTIRRADVRDEFDLERLMEAAVREAVPHLAGDARVLVPVREAPREARAAQQFAADLDRTVGVLDVGADADPAEVAPMVWWAARRARPTPAPSTDASPAATRGGAPSAGADRHAY